MDKHVNDIMGKFPSDSNKKGWLWVTLVIWLLADIIFLCIANDAWWDAGIYAGMGKFIFSGGHIGVWETFRPPLWPLLLGAAWKIGLSPAISGKALECLSAFGIMMLAYKISEKIRPGSGLMTAVIFGWTPMVLYFSFPQLSDLPSTFLAVLGTYYLLEERPTSAGLSASAAFLTRFPTGLIIVPMLIYSLVKNESCLKSRWKNILMLGCSFSILPIIYFIINFFQYGNPLLPIITGANYSSLGITNPIFYIIGLIEANPLFACGMILVIAYAFRMRHCFRQQIGQPMTLIILSLVILAAYFSISSHEEIRYSLVFVPYLAIVTGCAITDFLGRKSYGKKAYGIVVISLIFISVAVGLLYVEEWKANLHLSQEYVGYYDFFTDKPGAKVISTSPQLSLYSDIKSVSLADTAADLESTLSSTGISTSSKITKYASTYSADYVALDTCALEQPGSNTDAMTDAEIGDIISMLSAAATKEYDQVSHGTLVPCRLLIFKL